MNKLLIIAALLPGLHRHAVADIASHIIVKKSANCGFKQQIMVIPGKALPGLIGVPVERISLLKWAGTKFEPIPYQIDQRDEKNRYVLPDTNKPKPAGDSSRFDSNDELALLLQDAGQRLTALPENMGQDVFMEIEIQDAISASSRWLYAKNDASRVAVSTRAYIEYSPLQDTVSTQAFELGFSRVTPFLIDSLKWRTDLPGGWSQDVVDTMKIRHTGKLFGLIKFERNAADYHSRLVAVKQGPIRLIRRTENKVSMFWKLKSPSVLVDYLISPNGFTMDTTVDIPFPVGLFFTDLVTLTTVDWNNAENLPALTINSGIQPNGLVVNGHMSAEKIAFNSLNENTLIINSDLGSIQVTLTIPDDFPIFPQLYLRDDLTAIDVPEQNDGQFGNVGFKTTGWENIDTEVHHLEFNACLSNKNDAVQSLDARDFQHVQSP